MAGAPGQYPCLGGVAVLCIGIGELDSRPRLLCTVRKRRECSDLPRPGLSSIFPGQSCFSFISISIVQSLLKPELTGSTFRACDSSYSIFPLAMR